MTSKLHEILAVEPSLEKTANKLIKESLHTFNKDTLFKGIFRKLFMFKEEDKQSETEEFQNLETTVDENLDYIIPFISNWIDTNLKKEKANQNAKERLIIDGKIIAENLPATFLLGMETKINKIRSLYEQIPTLPPGIDWVKDEQNKDGVFKNKHSVIQIKTKKDPEFRVVVQPTQEHPAQVEKVDRVIDIGRYVTTQYCGMMTPLEKANRLKRIDDILKAIKIARVKANNVETEECKIAEKLFSYIKTGKV